MSERSNLTPCAYCGVPLTHAEAEPFDGYCSARCQALDDPAPRPTVEEIARRPIPAAAVECPPAPPATAQAGPLAVDCCRCHAKAGSRCKNYKGQNKPTCGERGRPAGAKKPEAPRSLFDTEE